MSFERTSQDSERQEMPKTLWSNEDLARFSIPEGNRPKLEKKLATILDLVRLSGPMGADIFEAVNAGNVRKLIFKDAVMDSVASAGTLAFEAKTKEGYFLGFRESSLNEPDISFALMRQVTHEAVHVRQHRDKPDLWKTSHPAYIKNYVNFEKEAFTDANEVMLRMMIQHTEKAEAALNRLVLFNETQMGRDLALSNDEGPASLQAFKDTLDRTGNVETSIKAARAATEEFFNTHHAEAYRQSAIEKLNGSVAPEPAPRRPHVDTSIPANFRTGPIVIR